MRRPRRPPTERGGALPVPADRRLRVPVQLPHRRPDRARRRGRLALRPALRLAQRLRHPARPSGGLLQARPVRDQPPDRAGVRARHQRPVHDLEDAVGLGRGPRRLTMGPRETEDEVTPHTRPPADDDADHLLVRTVRCLEGTVEIELVCEPVFDYGRTPAEWTLVDGSRHTADATGAGQTIRLQTDLALGVEGNRVRARHVLSAGEECYCALSWAEGLAAPADVAEANRRLDATTRFWRTWLGRARMPDHRWRDPIQRSALAIKGLTYMPTGATVAALTTSLPETPGGERNWDYRYTWMRDTTFTLAGAALPEPGLGGRRVHPVRRRPRAEPRRRAADHVRHRRSARPDRVHPRRSVRLRGRPTGADRQRSVRPTPERRVRRRPGLHPAAHPTQPPPAAAAVADRGVAGPMRHRRMARTRPGHLGGPRQAPALRVLQADGLGRAGPRVEAGRDPRRHRSHGDLAGHRR